MLEEIGFKKILEFKQIPCDVYFHPGKAVTLSIGSLNNFHWIKASKHMFIKSVQRKGETSIYSKLQEITKFMEYLKQNLPEFHCVTYYISDVTPRIALENFKGLPQLEKLFSEQEELEKLLTEEEIDEEKALEKLQRLKRHKGFEEAAKMLESILASRIKMRERITKIDTEIKSATSILNEWIQKGYAIALLWNFSTTIHICLKDKLSKTINDVLEELEMIEKLSIRARAYQQGLWIEEVRNPFYVYYAEALGLFHPKVLQTYKEHPLLQKFAEEVEEWFNARLAIPIERVKYKEKKSTAVAEAFASFLRQIETVKKVPKKKVETKLSLENIKKPIYFGFIAQQSSEKEFSISEIPFMMDLNELRKHCLITGTIGSGKTRIGQIIAETSCLHVPTIIIDPLGELTGMIKENTGMEKDFEEFKLKEPKSYDFAKIYTLDDVAIQFKTNLLKKPDVTGDFLIANADETALILSELLADERLRDIIRRVLMESWENNVELYFDNFMELVRDKAAKRKTSVKLDRLVHYKPLMAESRFSVEDLLKNKLSIISLSSYLYSDTAKLMIIWFILREILNYFLAQPSTEELRALLIIDEVHRFYDPNVPRNSANMLEQIVKQGRSKGLGVVMLSQSVKDLSETLTQANLRILLKILEGEILQYTTKFGLELARALHSLDPKKRIGYVFYGGEQFFCKFRPTLSMPIGMKSFDELKKHFAEEKAIELFNEQATRKITVEKPQVETIEEKKPLLSDDERSLIETVKEFHSKGMKPSQSQVQKKLGIGRSKVLRLISSLQEKGLINVVELKAKGHPKVVELRSE